MKRRPGVHDAIQQVEQRRVRLVPRRVRVVRAPGQAAADLGHGPDQLQRHRPRRHNGGERRHEGQDIFAPRGTPILSATNGFIYKIGENNLGGQTVSVIGSGGRVYYYAHLDSYAKGIEVGDRVTTRTVLGYVGTTGNAQGTPPHLHFGVYTMTGAINPLPLLRDRIAPTVTRKKEAKAQLVSRKA